MLFKHVDYQESDKVTLKPVLGIQPEQYLAVLCALVLALVLFFALVFPGLKNRGVLGVFDSEPRGAAVRVDGVTLGSTPARIFLPRGTRTVEMVLPGFTPALFQLEVRGRIFASAFIPQKRFITKTLVSPDPAAALAEGAAEFAAWAAAGEPGETSQAPMVLSQTMYRVAPAAGDPAVREQMNEILRTALRHTTTRAAARDLLRAKFLLDSRGRLPFPWNPGGTIADISAEFSSVRLNDANSTAGERAKAWFAYLRGGPEYSVLSGDESASRSSLITVTEAAQSAPIIVNGVRFLRVNGGTLSSGRTQAIPSFYMAADEISIEQWEAFSAGNGQWAVKMNTDFSGYPQGAASGINWDAAAAYCRWLNGFLPNAEIRLPGEAEWEYAALYFIQPGIAEKCENLEGGLWEWCDGVFTPLNFLLPAPLSLPLSPPERPVRGGSWVNAPGSVSSGTRGALPADSASPFVGFRPVLVPITQ
ncbi:MAG: SUMF1/EgtB/PvdO family nonheme iron enzyme [Treponema sp.]|jgi:hypothetical protein|nr:SUMF1/EgtB/PvdO family nonheme iron enzyme [Treponema sp.]